VRRTSLEDRNCSIAQCLEVTGDWWTLLILRDVFLGVRRFDELQVDLGISRNVLARRLDQLVADEILERRPYSDAPPRAEYVLTEKGRDLFPVLAAMMRWGDKWLSPDGPPINLLHHDHDTHAEVVCAECREPLELRDVSATLGPGFPERLRSRPDVAERFPDDSSMDQDPGINPPPE
jgi:DNA-binding HxlR family transcriptional regulator